MIRCIEFDDTICIIYKITLFIIVSEVVEKNESNKYGYSNWKK